MKKRILIIDSDEKALRQCQEALDHAHEVTCFSDARRAIAHYRNSPAYDLVVTDLAFEDRSGEGLLFDIRYINPAQKIAVLSNQLESLNLPSDFKISQFKKPTDIQNVVASGLEL